MSYLVIILQIRFRNLKSLIVTMIRGILRKTLNESLRNAVRIRIRLHQEVGKCISCAVRKVVVGQQTLRIPCSRANRIVVLITLRIHILRSKLQRVFPYRLADVVA